ncbi:nodulation protein NfeD [Sphingomonas oleivorans]|uniref:Nodulation protein NfeD n=2 Tax=Sphingomonas oleivorans TaxID=1735121 RepID=A0A2T5FVE7_9SPHN|nr:nodulation protein NfeD [Sphingomonas oleivorans]
MAGRRYGRLLSLLALILIGMLALRIPAMGQGQAARAPAILLDVDGAIGPAMADYVRRGLGIAAQRHAPLVIIRMDTPGGLDPAMRAIIRDILASPVPVATFVSPSGARAASAGTFILYASHVAAMAPGTNVGAATPVEIGGGMPGPGRRDEKDDAAEGGKGQSQPQSQPKPDSPMETKAVNDAVAYLRALAELRGRNADWAERAVREAASLSATAALAQRVIDIQARNIGDLLAQAHGRAVTIAGKRVILDTRGLSVEEIEPGWRTRLLGAITNPNVALILMMIGVYGLIFEFMTPGALYPGTIGAICLLVGLYAFAALPVNYAGVGLALLGIGLMIAEAFTPSFGILGIGGAIALALGATILVDSDVPDFRIDWQVIAGIVAVSLLFTLVVVRLAFRARWQGVASGREQMIGARGLTQDWEGRSGHVFVHGERWNAVSEAPVREGEPVRIVSLDGLLLHVEPDPSAKDRERRG